VNQHAARANIYAPLQVLIYSDNAGTRNKIKQALGRLPDTDMAPVDFVEAATHPAVMRQVASGKIDLAILDGEASPAGGLGVAKQLKDELLQCLPIVVLAGRVQDAWLAGWSKADAVVTHPIDPIELSSAVVPLLRSRLIAWRPAGPAANPLCGGF
jgi:CheY-like chemotaxis protein